MIRRWLLPISQSLRLISLRAVIWRLGIPSLSELGPGAPPKPVLLGWVFHSSMSPIWGVIHRTRNAPTGRPTAPLLRDRSPRESASLARDRLSPFPRAPGFPA